MKSTIINGTEFTEITYRYEGEEMPGLLIHDLNDANRDGDMIIGNGCTLPENETEAETILANETGETCFHLDGDVYVVE